MEARKEKARGPRDTSIILRLFFCRNEHVLSVRSSLLLLSMEKSLAFKQDYELLSAGAAKATNRAMCSRQEDGGNWRK
jgi:hypothetical protein